MTQEEPPLETRIHHQRLAAKVTVFFFFFTCLVVGLVAAGKIRGEVFRMLPPSIIAVCIVALLALLAAPRLARRAVHKSAHKRADHPPELQKAEIETTLQIVGAATITAAAHMLILAAMWSRLPLVFILGVVTALLVLRYLRAPRP